jgi:hypothetical protein
MGPSSRAATASATAAASSSSSASVATAGGRKNHRAKHSNNNNNNSGNGHGAAAVAVHESSAVAEMSDGEYLDYIGNYKPGTIRTIRLTNFLTHKDVVIRPGPR